MKKLITFTFSFLLALTSIAQLPSAITIEPPYATAYDELTLIFDPAEACFISGSLAGLDSIAIHSGVSYLSGETWQNVIDFNMPGVNGQLNTLYPTGDGRFSITYTPYEFYGFPAGSVITQICAVFNNGTDWTNDGRDFMPIGTQCMDFFIPIHYPGDGIVHVPGDYATIQAGIEAAADGEIVLVDEGTYFENINFKGKPIVVASNFAVDGDFTHISNTIIDGSQPADPDSASVVYFFSGENDNSVFLGFTITNGSGTFIPEDDGKIGGGIFCTNSSPYLSNLIIDGNSAYGGAGIYCESSELKLVNSSIINSKMFCEVGGGMACISSNPFLQNVIISNNEADWSGGIYLEGSSGYFIDVQITNNEGGIGTGMICSFSSNPILINSTIAENTAIFGGGIACVDQSNPVLINSILWNNTPEQVFFTEDWASNTITFSYTDIEDGEEGIVTSDNGTVIWQDGNINLDPLFADTGAYPFYLKDESPCVNTGIQDTAGLHLPYADISNSTRIFGNRIDMGAFENQAMYVWIADHIQGEEKLAVSIYPNPFSTSTTIEYELTKPSTVQLIIYDYLGKQVKVIEKKQVQGKQQIIWNAEGLPAGVYFCVIKTNQGFQNTKLIKL